ncbi:MAG: hypothetical protein ABN502_01960 [Gammaproteobacteria bacterium]
MGLVPWCLLFAAASGLAWWIVNGGGADWMEGWKAALLLDGPFAGFWNAEQIRLYVLLLWLAGLVWFVIGLFVPGARGFG